MVSYQLITRVRFLLLRWGETAFVEPLPLTGQLSIAQVIQE